MDNLNKIKKVIDNFILNNYNKFQKDETIIYDKIKDNISLTVNSFIKKDKKHFNIDIRITERKDVFIIVFIKVEYKDNKNISTSYNIKKYYDHIFESKQRNELIFSKNEKNTILNTTNNILDNILKDSFNILKDGLKIEGDK